MKRIRLFAIVIAVATTGLAACRGSWTRPAFTDTAVVRNAGVARIPSGRSSRADGVFAFPLSGPYSESVFLAHEEKEIANENRHQAARLGMSIARSQGTMRFQLLAFGTRRRALTASSHSSTLTPMMAASHQPTPADTRRHPPNVNCCTSHEFR